MAITPPPSDQGLPTNAMHWIKMAREAEAVRKQELQAKEEEKQQYRELLSQQQKEFEEFRELMRAEQSSREAKFQEEREILQSRYATQERKFRERQNEIERHAMAQQQEVANIRLQLSEQVKQGDEALQLAKQELKQEKDRYNEENRARLERTSKNYVVEALESLRLKERQFHTISKVWSVVGAGALAVGLGFFVYLTLSSVITMPLAITWELIVFTVIKGLVAVGLLGALSRYAFLFSNSYIRESLKNADRRHAIQFGKFYLESYGAAADWTQVKEAFEHWNIGGSSNFSRSEDVPMDAVSIDKAASILERVGNMLSKAKST